MRIDDDFYFLKVPQPPLFSKTEASFTHIGMNYHILLGVGITDLETFKKCLKTYYLKKAFDGIE